MELTSAEALDLSGAYVLDALTDGERVAFERRLATDDELQVTVVGLLEAASLLGATEADPPPPALADRTFTAALARRPAGVPAHVETDPAGAYRAQMDDLLDLLGSLAPGDWAAPTVAGFTVHELVAHLVAVEAYIATRLGVEAPAPHTRFDPPEGTENDHVAMTLPTVAAFATAPPGEAVDALAAIVGANTACLDAMIDTDLDTRVILHGLDLSVRSMIGTRIFEAWTHADDIRRAIGQPLESPGPARLRLMSNLAVRALPLGLVLAGIPDTGRTVRVVLTGAGGGEWVQPLTIGADPGPTDATLIADVVDFCRLAAKRLSPQDLVHRVQGDDRLARDVLVGAQVFAA